MTFINRAWPLGFVTVVLVLTLFMTTPELRIALPEVWLPMVEAASMLGALVSWLWEWVRPASFWLMLACQLLVILVLGVYSYDFDDENETRNRWKAAFAAGILVFALVKTLFSIVVDHGTFFLVATNRDVAIVFGSWILSGIMVGLVHVILRLIQDD